MRVVFHLTASLTFIRNLVDPNGIGETVVPHIPTRGALIGLTEMELSIVIISWNTCEILRACLESVFDQIGDLRAKVIVVDNASSDGSPDMVERQFPQVHLIRNDENRGFAAANNQAFGLTNSRHVLLLNSDTIILGNVLKESVRYMDAHEDVGMFGCRVLNPDRTVQRTCFQYPTLFNLFLKATGLSGCNWPQFLGREHMTHWDRDTERDVDVVTGCCMMVRRRAIEKVGSLDESFFFCGEETDWCRRFKTAGWCVRFAPVGEIIHIGNASGKQLHEQRALLLAKGLVQYHRKHTGTLAAYLAWALLWSFSAIRACLLGAMAVLGGNEDRQKTSRYFFHMTRILPEALPNRLTTYSTTAASTREKSPSTKDKEKAPMRILRSCRWLMKHHAFKRSPIATLWRCVRWEIAKLTNRPTRARLPWGVRLWCWPQRFRGVDGMVYILRDYEADAAFVQAFIKPGMNVIDIGANIGFYSVMMAKLIGPGGINYAFEAATETTDKLNRNIEENDLSNVTVFNVALSDHSEQRTLYHAQDRGRNSFGPEENVVATETVQCRRLDDLMDSNATIDFIKIDVEGAELLVLRGAEDLLRRSPHAPILCEFNASKARSVGFSLKQLAAFFNTRGYDIYQYQLNDGMLVPVAEPAGFHGNIIAVHRDHTSVLSAFLPPSTEGDFVDDARTAFRAAA